MYLNSQFTIHYLDHVHFSMCLVRYFIHHLTLTFILTSSVTTLARRFPDCDFSGIEPGPDPTWTKELESLDQCANRGYQSLRWVVGTPCSCSFSYGSIQSTVRAFYLKFELETLCPPTATLSNCSGGTDGDRSGGGGARRPLPRDVERLSSCAGMWPHEHLCKYGLRLPTIRMLLLGWSWVPQVKPHKRFHRLLTPSIKTH